MTSRRERRPSTQARLTRRRALAGGAFALTSLLAGCGGRRNREGNAQNTEAARTPSPPPTATSPPGVYIVDPVNGRDNYSGRSPSTAFASFEPLSLNGRVQLRPGDVVKVRATAPITPEESIDLYRIRGTEDEPIVIEPYGDGRPLIDATDVDGNTIQMAGAQYVTIRGLEIANSESDAIRVPGLESGAQPALNCRFEDLELHHYGVDSDGSANGLGFYRDSFGHVVRDVVCHHGADDGNSDGFYVGGRNDQFSGGHRFERCVAYLNADDGFDFFRCDPDRPSVLVDCVAYSNGHDGDGAEGDGNGFKMGGGWETGGNRLLRCLSYDNDAVGFDCNGASEPNTFDNCTAYGNGTFGFKFSGNTDPDHLTRNCIAYDNADGPTEFRFNTISEANTWDLDIEDPAFASVEEADERFLHLSAESPCIDAGLDVGVVYSGEAPDLGAYEFGVEGASENEDEA